MKLNLNLAAMLLLSATTPPTPTTRDPRPLDRVPVYGRPSKPAPKRKVKPGQTVAEADERIRAAEAKRRRRALSPAARRYVGLIDRYLSLLMGDESMDAAINAAHDDLTPDDVAAIRAWQEVTR